MSKDYPSKDVRTNGTSDGKLVEQVHSVYPRWQVRLMSRTSWIVLVALAVRRSSISSWRSAAKETADPDNLNCFADDKVTTIEGTDFEPVDQRIGELGPIPMAVRFRQSAFVNKHKSDLMVSTLTGTSVNHTVAQKRAVNGNEAWRGRTLQEGRFELLWA